LKLNVNPALTYLSVDINNSDGVLVIIAVRPTRHIVGHSETLTGVFVQSWCVLMLQVLNAQLAGYRAAIVYSLTSEILVAMKGHDGMSHF